MTYFRVVVEDIHGTEHTSVPEKTTMALEQLIHSIANGNGHVFMKLRSGGYRLFTQFTCVDIDEITKEEYEHEHN